MTVDVLEMSWTTKKAYDGELLLFYVRLFVTEIWNKKHPFMIT